MMGSVLSSGRQRRLCLWLEHGSLADGFGPEQAGSLPGHSEVILLNRTDRPAPMPGEADVKYLDGDFRVLRPGAFVRCAVTGVPDPARRVALLERRPAGGLCHARSGAAAGGVGLRAESLIAA